MIVDMRFSYCFHDPIFAGTKTTTLRRRQKGEQGDLFIVEGRPFVITDVKECNDMQYVLSLWKKEGFISVEEMLDWIKFHDYNLPLYLHTFKEFAGSTVYLAGEPFELCSKPFKALEKQKLHTKKYEGLYQLDNGNLLDCHEWLDPVWANHEKPPYGSIYYDIYDPKAIDEEDPIPIGGGTIGYAKHKTLRHLEKWIFDCHKGLIIEKIGEAVKS